MSEKGTFVLEFQDSESMKQFFEDKTNSLFMNMSGGLLPEYLSKDEVDLLVNRFGIQWFEELGYTEPEYNKPTFE